MKDLLIYNLDLLIKDIEDSYIPITVSNKMMTLFNEFSQDIPNEQVDNIIAIIAMSMGEEFLLTKVECLDIINNLKHSLCSS